MNFTRVPGKKKNHKIKIFTLSTCGWCKKTKQLLKDLELEYEYLDMDNISGGTLESARNELKKYNPSCSYPTLVIDGGKEVIVGFKEEEIKKTVEE